MSKEGQTAVVSGTVTYRERMALHPLSTLTVQLQDVSRAGAPAILIGKQTYQTNGKQVPLPFEIGYDEAAIDPRSTYAISARITDPEGKLRFINDTIIPVITRGTPTSKIVVPVVGVVR